MEEFQGRRRRKLTTREWCNPVNNSLHHFQKGLSGTTILKRFENGGSVLGRPVEVTQEAGVVLAGVTRCHRVTLLVAIYDTQGNGGCIQPPTHRGKTNNVNEMFNFMYVILTSFCQPSKLWLSGIMI